MDGGGLMDNSGGHDAAGQEFDFASFLNTLSTNDNVDYGDAASTAFLDEVPPPADAAGTSPIISNLRLQQQQQKQQQQQPQPQQQQPPDLPETQQKTKGRKRKSDVADVESGEHQSQQTQSKPMADGGAKQKRRRDR